MVANPVPVGGPAAYRGGEYQLLWSLFHATQWKVEIGADHGITAVLEPESGVDFEYRFGKERRVEQIKIRSTGRPWSFKELVFEVLPSLYRSVDIKVSTAYVFVTEGKMGRWQDAYDLFQRIGIMPVPSPGGILAHLSPRATLNVGGKKYSERSLFKYVAKALAGRNASDEELLRVWNLLKGFHFQGDQDYATLIRKIDRALANHGTPPGDLERKRTSLVGDLFHRVSQGQGKLESSGFFKSHGLSEISLRRWVDIQARAAKYMLDYLGALRYRRDWDAREISGGKALFIEETKQEESVPPQSSERPLVSARPAVLLTGESGQGKSWQLYRLGYELAMDEQIIVLIQGTGTVDSDFSAIAETFCREIWGSSSGQSLRDVADLVRRELPELRDPWLTVLIDGVRDEDYALSLLQFPWQRHGIRVVLGSRWCDRFSEVEAQVVHVSSFSVRELSNYLRIRLGVEWIDLPDDVWQHMKLPLFAKLFCDLQGSGATWKPVNEYHLFGRAWSRQISAAPLAASAVAGLAALLPEEQVYPWSLSRVWAIGLRDREIQDLVDSGLLRFTSGSRSLEIWHDRILNWAVAEGLVSQLRSGEITVEALLSRAIQGRNDERPLRGRLGYVTMDTLWLLTTPEFGLGDAVRQYLEALEAEWEPLDLERNLPTLGERIVPYLFSHLASLEREDQ